MQASEPKVKLFDQPFNMRKKVYYKGKYRTQQTVGVPVVKSFMRAIKNREGKLLDHILQAMEDYEDKLSTQKS